ncbi:MAG: hypothetical protein IJS68_03755 [Clostridia bacterium]|nr:hypothetical protein [Clostridia bacterium]
MISNSPVNVRVVNDKSVERAIKRNTKKLAKKYARKRSEVNEDWLDKENTPAFKVISVIVTIITLLITTICVVLCIGTIASSIHKTPAMFFGYSMMKVATGSMTAETITIDGTQYPSGFAIGENIVIHSVDTKTLKVGDKIAFYAYSKNYVQYHNVAKEEIQVSPNTQTKYKTSIGQFLGFHSQKIVDAAENKGLLTFHHITNIFQDENGKRWFKTQGSKNASKDTWYISEEMVVGIYTESSLGQFISTISNMMNTTMGFILILLVPVSLLIANLLHSVIKDLQLSLLVLDVVEEKRKLTDDICIKNGIGYRMDQKTKYKVLCQADEDEKLYYISLLWHNGSAPSAIKKYAIRKRYILEPTKRLLEINRECERLYNEGKSMRSISKYYTEQRNLIQQQTKENIIRMRNMQKAFQKTKGE